MTGSEPTHHPTGFPGAPPGPPPPPPNPAAYGHPGPTHPPWVAGPSRRSRLPFSVSSLVALCVAAAGFVLSVSVYSSTTENGVVTDCSYKDYGALVLGPAAAIAGVVAILHALTRRQGAGHRLRNLGIGLLCIAVGGLHVLRGLGEVTLFMDDNPCL